MGRPGSRNSFCQRSWEHLLRRNEFANKYFSLKRPPFPSSISSQLGFQLRGLSFHLELDIFFYFSPVTQSPLASHSLSHCELLGTKAENQDRGRPTSPPQPSDSASLCVQQWVSKSLVFFVVRKDVGVKQRENKNSRRAEKMCVCACARAHACTHCLTSHRQGH